MSRRHRLILIYILFFFVLVGGALLVSGAMGAYFSYRDGRTAIDKLQREQASSAAVRISQFLTDESSQLQSLVPITGLGAATSFEDRATNYHRALRQTPSITDLSFIDGNGREQVFVSRLD